jgi:hypothetical protein
MATYNSDLAKDFSLLLNYTSIVGGNYIVQNGSLGKYQNSARGIYVEITAIEISDDFNCCCSFDRAANKKLSSLTNGSETLEFSFDSERNLYCFTNGHQAVELPKVEATLRKPSIDAFTALSEAVGVPVFIDEKGQCNLTGKEKSVRLAIRDETFTGIITAAHGEYFFNPKSREELQCRPLTVVHSHYFLKIGKKNFEVQLYRAEGNYWLSTKVVPGTGIEFKMLERLTICQ